MALTSSMGQALPMEKPVDVRFTLYSRILFLFSVRELRSDPAEKQDGPIMRINLTC